MAAYRYNQALKPAAQKLRREMTPEAKHLWYQFFKAQGIKARRQMIIRNDIVDFYIPSARLAIVIGNSPHDEQEACRTAEERDAALDRLGILVLYCSRNDISMRVRDVCQNILLHMRERTQIPHLPED